MEKKRCFGEKEGQELYAKYHDEEWGVEVHEDRKLFEMLVLEGAQAGLSWETVLKRREGYRRAFYGFDVRRVAGMSDEELEGLMGDEGIIRNRLKIYSVRKNAEVFLKIEEEFGTFDRYIWGFVGGEQKRGKRVGSLRELPVRTEESDRISKDLKKRGMSFVGSTIMYAYMQAVGMVDDHLEWCWCVGRG